MEKIKQRILRMPIREFVKFCVVGTSGVFVDMAILWLLAGGGGLGLNISLSKFIAAETALINNFLWNNYLTFKERHRAGESTGTFFKRFLKFNAICGIGIGLGILLLNLFHNLLGINLYLSNLLSIGLVTFWNFGLNARFNWIKNSKNSHK